MRPPPIATPDDAHRRMLELYRSASPEEQLAFAKVELATSPCSLFPVFVEAELRPLLAHATEQLAGAIERVGRAFFEDPRVAQELEVPPRFLFHARLNPGYARTSVVTRMDGILDATTGAFKFLEFNCDDPSGMGTYTGLLELLPQSPLYAALASGGSFATDRLVGHFATALRRAMGEYNRSRGRAPDAPLALALLVDRQGPLANDHNLIARHLEAEGLHAFCAGPEELVLDGDRLTARGRPIDFAYRDDVTAYLRTRPAADRPARLRERLLQAADELGARSPAADRALSRLYLGRGPHALVQAYRRGTVGVVNPFRAHVVDLKAVMAVMQSEEHRHLFTDAQHEAIARHVPWTRIVRPEAVLFEGQRVPLVGLLRENRTRFVLKPDAGCGGEGVVVGQGVDEPTWAAALALAQEPGQRYVAQEYVPMREDERPTVRKDASLFVGPQRVNVNTWAFDGAFGGAYARAAADFVVNVSKGGRFAPLVYVGGA